MKLLDIAVLTNIKGLGSANIVKILTYCKTKNIKNLYELKYMDLSKIVNAKLANTIENYLDIDINNLYNNMKNLIDSYKSDGIDCISINDHRYPDSLRESTSPPALLYCKGNMKLLNSNCIAVIGTRKNTSIGKKITIKTIEFLVENNFTIVSGLAKGIDTIAHKTTLEYQAKTIAVLPLIDIIFPAENKHLADDILKNGGLLISEERPKTRFFSAQLVKRDRIQSGLSKAIFVIEASFKGGSMHATNDALKLKKSVFTPNIYELNTDYQNLKQISGIKNLIDTNKSTAYSSKNYDDVLGKLNHRKPKDTLW